jgi:hypothetical protein
MIDRSESAISTRSEGPASGSSSYEKGQRLYCARCKSEIEIVSPCSCEPAEQEFSCCGEPMKPNTGVEVNVEG